MDVLVYEDSKQRRFIVAFVLVGLGLFLLMYTNQQNLISRPVNSFTAYSVKELAEVFAFTSNVEQRTYIRERGSDKIYVPTTLLTVGNYTARVILECSAVHVSILLVTFLLAYPAPGLHKIQGITLLVPCLIAFNTIRIFLLMLLGHYFGQGSLIFNLFHVYIMQVLIIALVLVLALFWLRRIELRKIDAPIWFFFRFLAVSGALTLIWVFVRNRYDLHTGIYDSSLYPFLTFSSLVLASTSFKIRQEYKELLLCFVVMIGFSLFVQAVYWSYVHFHLAVLELLYVMANSAFKYLLPFGLFFILIRRKLFIRTNTAGHQLFRCPLCNKSDIRNLRGHAQAKHSIELEQGNERLWSAIKINENSLKS